MASGPDTVFFLSDFGGRDEFAGVVRAVLRRLAPGVVVIDLTHEIPPFDVAAGARALERALPFLGPGVVLAVVDPGVGSARRGVAFEAGTDPVRFFVGPDNGLLTGAAEWAGAVTDAVTLPAREPAGPATFDGRDVFAPAVARLCGGARLSELGDPLDPASLVRLAVPPPAVASLADGRSVWWCEVLWIDRFGNAQLNLGPEEVLAEAVLVWPGGATAPGEGPRARRVRAFAQLAPDELGIITDSAGRLALVRREGSAAATLGLGVGDTVGLAEPGAGT